MVCANNGTGATLDFFEVTIPASKDDFLTIVSIGYSMVPWIAACLLTLLALAIRRVTLLLSAILCGVCLLVTEGILKQVIIESRPSESCLTSRGMPASHACLAICLTTWVTLELIFHQIHSYEWSRLLLWLFMCLMLLPVPAANMHLHDATQLQAIVGSMIGLGIAFLYFLTLHFIVSEPLERSMGGSVHFTYDYGWPRVPSIHHKEICPGFLLPKKTNNVPPPPPERPFLYGVYDNRYDRDLPVTQNLGTFLGPQGDSSPPTVIQEHCSTNGVYMPPVPMQYLQMMEKRRRENYLMPRTYAPQPKKNEFIYY